MPNLPLILIADDDPDFMEIICARLKNRGFNIQTAADGDQAVSAARAYKPNLILMDVQMPNKDGITAATEILEVPELKNTRIIFLTNLGDPSPTSIALNRKFSRELGAADYFKKSGDYEKLVLQIQDILSNTSPSQ